MFYGDAIYYGEENMVITKKPKLSIEEVEWKGILENAVTRTNSVIDKWKLKDKNLNISKSIATSDVEAVFFNFIRRPLFSTHQEYRRFSTNIQVFINPTTKHIVDIIDMSVNLKESNTINYVLSPSEIKLQKLLDIVSSLNFKKLDTNSEIFETDIEE